MSNGTQAYLDEIAKKLTDKLNQKGYLFGDEILKKFPDFYEEDSNAKVYIQWPGDGV